MVRPVAAARQPKSTSSRTLPTVPWTAAFSTSTRRVFTSLTMARDAWSGSYSLQYIGSADDINAAPGDLGDHAPSVTYHNVQLKYAVNDAFDVALGVDNLWDKEAPFIQSYTDANTDTMTYDLLGRRWYARIGYRW